MATSRNAETKDNAASLTRRSLFELAGLALAATAISPALATEKPFRSSVPPAKTPADTVGPVMTTLSTYMSEAGAKALPDEVAEKTKQHILDTFARHDLGL